MSSSPKRRRVGTSSTITGASRFPVAARSTAQQNRSAASTSGPQTGVRGRRGAGTNFGRSAAARALRAWLRCHPVVWHNSSRILPLSALLARL